MPEPLSDDRLAVIRAEVTRPSKYALEADAKDMACELLAEVDRLRDLLGHASRFTFGPSGPYDHPHAAIDVDRDDPEGSEDIQVLARPGLDKNADGVLRWSVMCAGWARTHGGRWVHEPNPSDRSEKYLRATRWPTRDAALAVAEQLMADGHPDSATWATGRRYPTRDEDLEPTRGDDHVHA